MNREALENYDEIAHQNVSAALVCTGELKLTPDAPQPFELAATSIAVEGVSAPDYPLQKKRATVEFLRTQQHLRPRTNLFRAVFRVRSVAAAAIHRFFQDRGFVYVNTPIVTASDCEGAGEMFHVSTIDPANPPLDEHGNVDYSKDFFGAPASLTVSGQLNAENFAMAFGDVYTFGPTFRAENSNTTRHAAEFWMIEPEIAFADLADDMNLAEDMLKAVIRDVMDRCPDELAMLNKFVDKGQHPDRDRERLRGRGRDVPRQHHRPGQPAAGRARQRGLLQGLLRRSRLAHCFRPAQRRELRHGLRRCVHLRPHVPR